jgi:ParB-like chromosome segregation protein Spo0J
MPRRNGAVEQWKVSRLKPHPRQADNFDNLPEAEFAALVDDMREHGQRHAVEILPDETIIAGHQRVEAAKVLGWEKIDVKVRQDLAESGDAASEAELIRDNLYGGRNLSPLARARPMARLMELETELRGGPSSCTREEIKTAVGARMGLSERSVSRYLLVLETPKAVQRAVDRGELGLVLAGRLTQLSSFTQKQVAERISKGEKARTVVQTAVRGGYSVDGEHSQGLARVASHHSFMRLKNALHREVRELRGRSHEIDQARLRSALPILKAAMEVFTEFIEAAEPPVAECRSTRGGKRKSAGGREEKRAENESET